MHGCSTEGGNATDTGILIKKLNNIARRYAMGLCKELSIHDSSISQSWMLDFLFRNQEREINQKDIEQRYGINRATTSRMLKLLEEQGLISRRPSELDSRKKLIQLEKKGYELQQVSMKMRSEMENEFRTALTEAELKEFRRLCAKLINHLEGDMHENDKSFDELD